MEICTVGSVRGESVGAAMVDLNGHEAGNGGYGQGRSTARRVLLYSETTLLEMSGSSVNQARNSGILRTRGHVQGRGKPDLSRAEPRRNLTRISLIPQDFSRMKSLPPFTHTDVSGRKYENPKVGLAHPVRTYL